ncbi:MAG: TetR/AcrR family transcriptional regulator [Spirochaetaceae bacterium]|nr:MAG: TetR/AcrR family transcriptional regulator [Spirochaetaceae bacterium]
MAKLIGGDPDTQKGEKTRKRIFDAAVREFSSKGYAGARVDRIAEAAKINKQRIYAYFGDKEGLFVAVWQHTSDLINAMDHELLDLGDDDIPRLGQILLQRYNDFHEAHPDFWRIFMLENLMGDRHHPRLHKDRPYTHIRELYERGQAQGHFDPTVSFESFLFVLIAVPFFYTSNWRTMSDTLATDLSRPEVKERTMNEIGRMLFGRARPPGE